MIESELAFIKLGLIGRFQIVTFFHVLYSHEFVNLSLVEITYIMNTHHHFMLSWYNRTYSRKQGHAYGITIKGQKVQ